MRHPTATLSLVRLLMLLDSSGTLWYNTKILDAAGNPRAVARPDSNFDALCADRSGFTARPGLVLNRDVAHPLSKQIVLCTIFGEQQIKRKDGTIRTLPRWLESIANIGVSTPGRDGSVNSWMNNYASVPGAFVHELFHILEDLGLGLGSCMCSSAPGGLSC